MKNILLTAVGAMISAAAAAAPPPLERVGASEWGDARSVVVRYSDLNLSTSAGVSDLRRRIASAVNEVCALPNAEQLGQRARVSECRATALRIADEQATRLITSAHVVADRN